MRWSVVLLVACRGSSSVPAPSPGSGSAIAAVPLPPPPPPDRAYVADASGLVEVTPATNEVKVIAPGNVTWCNVDARANVVWYVTDGGLVAFDLGDRTSIPIIKGDLSNLEPIIDWGNEQLGGENRLEFDVGLQLAMTGTPATKQVMGCDGDAAFSCYEEDGKTPTKQVAELQHRAQKLAFADPAAVAKLAARGAHRSLWSPPPMPPAAPKPPAIAKARCSAQPDDCGKLVAIPGSALWLVVTANSQGDFFHETRELWDPATGEFLQGSAAGVTRAKHPAANTDELEDLAGMRVSPVGLSHAGLVFDATHVIYAPKELGRTCGWSSGGWRVKWGGEP
jgi:hypothetical protein